MAYRVDRQWDWNCPLPSVAHAREHHGRDPFSVGHGAFVTRPRRSADNGLVDEDSRRKTNTAMLRLKTNYILLCSTPYTCTFNA